MTINSGEWWPSYFGRHKSLCYPLNINLFINAKKGVKIIAHRKWRYQEWCRLWSWRSPKNYSIDLLFEMVDMSTPVLPLHAGQWSYMGSSV